MKFLIQLASSIPAAILIMQGIQSLGGNTLAQIVGYVIVMVIYDLGRK